MTWAWRGDFFPANRGEYETIRNQLEAERNVPHFAARQRRSRG